MTDLELMQQALEALERGRPQIRGALVKQDQDAAITALRERLAQKDEQAEPVIPKRRTPLTDEQIAVIAVECEMLEWGDDISFARAIERAHGIGEEK